MRKAKVVRLVEDSPEGPGIVLQAGDDEVFLPAEEAAELLGKLHYILVPPITIEFAADEMEKLGPIRISENRISIDAEELATKEGQRQFREALLKHPELRKLLLVKHNPDGTLSAEPVPEIEWGDESE